MRVKRSIILIDGSNFYFKLKDLKLQNLLSFDFTSFLNSLLNTDQLIYSIYYVGKVRTDGTAKTQRLFNDQRRLLAHLKKNNIRYSLGYLLKSNGRFHEKGVDVNIAVDILVAAYENICDQIILISSDTDLIPAIRKAKKKEKTVKYIGFSHQPSLAMITNCTNSQLLTKKELFTFIKR